MQTYARMAVNSLIAVVSWLVAPVPSQAQSDHRSPWMKSDAIILIDPFEGNDINWDKITTDPHVKAVIHRASIGMKLDSAFVTRAAEAKKRGLLWGAFHLGRPGNPIGQAKLLLTQAAKTNARFLALDIDGTDTNKFISLSDAQIFLNYVHRKTGSYPAVYANLDVYKNISSLYSQNSAFAKGPLWIARFQRSVGLTSQSVWNDYTIWQFSSEINCSDSQKCLYQVPGTKSDMDIDYFRGNLADLKHLFN